MTEFEDRRLDGNAAAGPLRQLFAVDLVAAFSTCRHCRSTTPLGSHVLYAEAPALVLRCPGCGGVILRCGEANGQLRVDFSGTALLRLDLTQGL
jgi:hypothetical protein